MARQLFATLEELLEARALANQALSISRPVSQGTFLVSGGSVAFQGGRTFTVAPATYVINGTGYTTNGGTVVVGAGDALNPRVDAIVVDTAGVVSVIAGVASVTPAFPDVDPLLYLIITPIRIDAAAVVISIATTDIYRENVEAWVSSVSGGTITANSATLPRTGAKSVEATNAINGDYVRFTLAAPVSLSGQRQLVLYINPKAAFPNAKSIAISWQLAGVKVGQTISISNGAFGFNHASATYQQIVIPITSFGVPADTKVDRLQLQVVGGGGAIGWRADDVFLEGASTAVPDLVVTALSAMVEKLRVRSITIIIDGGGANILAGIQGEMPLDFGGKILSWKLYGDGVGNIQIDLWKDTHANYPPTVADTITAAAKPALVGANKASGSASTWVNTFNEGDVLKWNVDALATVTRATLVLKTQVG